MPQETSIAVDSQEPAKSKIKLERVISCGLVTGAIYTLLKALEEPFFDQAFFAALRQAGSPVRHELPAWFLVFAVGVGFLLGIYSVWLYAAIRPRYGPGAKSAAIAGLAVWLLIALTDSMWASFQLLPVSALAGPLLCTLPEIVIALLVGAKFYRE